MFQTHSGFWKKRDFLKQRTPITHNHSLSLRSNLIKNCLTIELIKYTITNVTHLKCVNLINSFLFIYQIVNCVLRISHDVQSFPSFAYCANHMAVIIARNDDFFHFSFFLIVLIVLILFLCCFGRTLLIIYRKKITVHVKNRLRNTYCFWSFFFMSSFFSLNFHRTDKISWKKWIIHKHFELEDEN